ncbi:hypothetical protein [Azohydromonas aeria]|uniref:hypothetical protein n=1 Tax=Azohydromonas aeria TaxID=2590212 RepID=UPI0012F8F0FD|nr:hypothetical protein [Azohydromonas aeria]
MHQLVSHATVHRGMGNMNPEMLMRPGMQNTGMPVGRHFCLAQVRAETAADGLHRNGHGRWSQHGSVSVYCNR